jgi:histidinol-phosphate aminotransferase
MAIENRKSQIANRKLFEDHKMTRCPIKPRREVAHFEPYLPGRSTADIRRTYGLRRVVKMSANENALGPSPRAMAALRRSAGDIHYYPDGFMTDLRRVLARRLRVKPGQLVFGAGSDELIELLAKAYLNRGDDIVISAHTFIRYQLAAELMGVRVRVVPMKNFTHDLDAMARAATKRTRFAFVANPNNPTGTYNTAAQLDAFLRKLPRHVIPVIDEAYFEYAAGRRDFPDALRRFSRRPMVVMRTFSKIYGLAGIRVGYAVMPGSMVRVLDAVRLPFSVASSSQAAAVAALADDAHVKRSRRLIEREMPKMERAVAALGVRWVPSASNSLMVSVPRRSGDAVQQALLRRGVLVRAMREYGFPGHVRVTLGKPAENRFFIRRLKEVLA